MKKVIAAVLVLLIGSSNPSSAQFNGYGPYGGGGAGGLMPWNGMGGYMPFLGMMNRYEGQFMSNVYSNAFYGPAYGAGNYGQGGNGAWGAGSVYTPSAPFRW